MMLADTRESGTLGRQVVERALAELGHREITYVIGPEASWADGVRWRALRESSLELEIRVRRSRSDQPTVLPVKSVIRASTAPRAGNTIAPSPRAGNVTGPAGAR